MKRIGVLTSDGIMYCFIVITEKKLLNEDGEEDIEQYISNTLKTCPTNFNWQELKALQGGRLNFKVVVVD
jgi:hypothetical protein